MLQIKAGAQRMRIGEFIGTVGLPGQSRIAFEGVLSDAVVEQIPDPVRFEIKAGIAGGERALQIESALRVLPAHDRVLRQLVLVLVQIVAQKVGHALVAQAVRRLQALLVRNLELLI